MPLANSAKIARLCRGSRWWLTPEPGVNSGRVLARTVGVIAAGLGAIYNFAWLPSYPVWSIVIIAICIALIWALTAHGRDIANR